MRVCAVRCLDCRHFWALVFLSPHYLLVLFMFRSGWALSLKSVWFAHELINPFTELEHGMDLAADVNESRYAALRRTG